MKNMKRKKAEKAAIEHVDNVLDCHIDYTVINYEEDNYEAGRRDALQDFGKELFIAGAKWRINDVWHDASEIPEEGKSILIIDNEGCCGNVLFISKEHWEKIIIGQLHIVKWVYIQDLLPNLED